MKVVFAAPHCYYSNYTQFYCKVCYNVNFKLGINSLQAMVYRLNIFLLRNYTPSTVTKAPIIAEKFLTVLSIRCVIHDAHAVPGRIRYPPEPWFCIHDSSQGID